MITLKGITFQRQDGQRQRLILNDISHRFYQGEQIALIGDSGAGKTTLLRLIGALEPLQAGEITIGERHLSGMTKSQRALQRRSQGMVFQDCRLLSTISARDNIMLSYHLAGLKGHPPLFDEIVARLKIGDLLERLPSQLSGGEQQRVAIARALIHQPKLVLADEPTGNLDNQSADRVCELLQQLCKEQGTTLLMVTHSLRLAKRFEQQLRLEGGNLVANGAHHVD